MEFLDLARKRYSVTQYAVRRIEPIVLDKILEAGMLAPTACNNQPQRILVIRTEERKQKLAQLAKDGMYFDTALLVCWDEEACWHRSVDGKLSGEIDASIVTTHMMLEATDQGVGSIWVMNWDPEAMRETFALPETIHPAALLYLGYPAHNSMPRPGHNVTKSVTDILL